MAMIITPRHLAQRAELYYHLSQMTAAGVPLMSALNSELRSSRTDRAHLTLVHAQLEAGSTLSEALATTGKWLPAFDLAMLKAAEVSGRLAEIFNQLARYYDERARLARQIAADLAYPGLLLHLAIFIGPLPTLLLQGDLLAYAQSTLGLLLPIYAVIALFLFAIQSRHGEGWRALLERITRLIPILGDAQRCRSLARLSTALEALINAGVPILEAWPLAAEASGSPDLKKTVRSWQTPLQMGRTPAEMVASSRKFPDLFTQLYQTGEAAGKLDDSMVRAHALYNEEATRKFRIVAEWGPRLLYMAVMLYVAWRVVSFWLGYFNQQAEAIGL